MSAKSVGRPSQNGEPRAGRANAVLRRLAEATGVSRIAKRVKGTPIDALKHEAQAREKERAERAVAAGRKRRASVGACAPTLKRDAFVVLDEIREKPEGERFAAVKKLLASRKPFEREGACRWLVFDAERQAVPLLKQLVKSKDASIQEYKKALVGKLIKLGETSNETLQLAKPVLVSRDSIDGTYRFAMLDALKSNREVRVAKFLLELAEKLAAQSEAPIRVELEYASRLILNNALAHADTDRLLRQAERRK